MSFQKPKTDERTGAIANYHTITQCEVMFSMLPTFDGEGNMLTSGSASYANLSSFVSKEFYDSVNGDASKALFSQQYVFDIFTVGQILRVPNAEKSAEDQLYDLIVSQDAFWQDAERVV